MPSLQGLEAIATRAPPHIGEISGLAAKLAANVSAELYDDLVNVIAGAVDKATDDAEAAYWLAVYDALTE